jgi:hypothetical protein
MTTAGSFTSTHFCRCRHASNRKRPSEHKASMQRNQASTRSDNKTSEKRKIHGRYVSPAMGKKAHANQIDRSHASPCTSYVVGSIHPMVDLRWVMQLITRHGARTAPMLPAHACFFLVREPPFRSDGSHGKCVRIEIRGLRCMHVSAATTTKDRVAACTKKSSACKAPSKS